MGQNLSRRIFILSTTALIASTAIASANPFYDSVEGEVGFQLDPKLLPPAESHSDFVITPANLEEIPQEFHRTIVAYEGLEDPGTIVVDPEHRFLYHVMDDGSAVRYGVGVGRQGFAWSGQATVGMKRRWPRWLPPEERNVRDLQAAVWANGMPGGPHNPLGARALYLHVNGQDTLFRIHGTTEPKSIGKALSSGCIRMLNQDVAELFESVKVGTKVVVLPAGTI